MSKSFVIGITGGSGSGKTAFVQQLASHFNEDDICKISQDNYYIEREKQPIDENGVENYDSIHSIDYEQLANDLFQLKGGESITRKEYTFNNPSRTGEARVLTFTPAPIVIVEGLFVLYHQQVVDLLDLKVFVDARDHIKLKRRIIRDKEERGYDLDDVLYRYEKHAMPTYDRFIKPLKEEADLVVPNNEHFDMAAEVLAGFLHAKLSKLNRH